MNSMTGYGYKEVLVKGTQISVEIRSVNSRFLDLNINLPPYLNPLEARIRTLVSQKVVRGKIDVSIRVRDTENTARVTASPQAALEYHKAILSIAKELGMSKEEVPLNLIIAQEGVLSICYDYDAESYWQKIQDVFLEVLECFAQDRAREGKNLQRDLLEKLAVLDECAAFFREWQPQMEAKFRESISARFTELLGDLVDENRIMQETAALLVKYTINEEIIRLQSHITAMKKELAENPAPGKRLDFICQEANREINTIGSKNQFVEVGAMVVNAKDALENIREQAKNVE